MASLDARQHLHKEMNATDMNERGDRWCLMRSYGEYYTNGGKGCVRRILAAWDVVDQHLIEDGEVTNDTGPTYMLRFRDGKWRYAYFGGINGSPCASCRYHGFEAPNGKAARIMDLLEMAINRRIRIENDLKIAQDKVAGLKEELSAAMREAKQA